jgi:myo-inositol 2-dehydrogenase / D-chiro-inositol 1-dehydrogenase
MHVGLVGAGRIGAFHARALAASPDVDRLTVADLDAELAARVATGVGAGTMPQPRDLPDAGVDALVIAAATAAHAELIHLGADARLPTFCEKPIALDLETTNGVIEHAAKAGIALQIGFQRRFDAGYREARRRRAAGELGRLYVARLATHDPAPPHEGYISVSGGIFRDLHIHDFDSLRWVTGQEVIEVYADGAVLHDQMFARHGDVDTAVAVLRLADGTLGIVSGSRHDPRGYDVRMELFGSGDSISVGLDGRTPLRSAEPGVAAPTGRQGYRNFMERFEAAYRAELRAFLEVARGEAASPCTGEDARSALVIAIAADRSRAEHRPVRVEEVA